MDKQLGMLGRLKRVDQIVGSLIDGRTYLVPTVRAEWLKTHGVADWPVIGPRHKDPDLGVDISHYHIDLRFVPFADFQRDNNTVVNESCDAPIRYEPWTCRQACVVISNVRTPLMVDLNRRYAGKQCMGSRKLGWICPHKKLWLGSQPPVKGMITCPGHGLRIDADSGRILEPD